MRHGPVRHGAAARGGRPAKRRAPGPRMRTRRFSPGRASPDSVAQHKPAHCLTAPLCNRVADDGLYPFVGHKARASPDCTTPAQPSARRSLAPLPRLTASRLTAPRRNRVADDGLYPFVEYKARASPDCIAPAHPAARRSLAPLPRLTGAVGLRCSAQTRSSPDCVAPYRPVHRPTAPRLLSRPRVARLPPLPRLTANRLTAPPHNRIMDDGLYLFVGHKARASPNRTTSLTRPRAARLTPASAPDRDPLGCIAPQSCRG